ncbi:hypothetical protein BKA62DRAFT_689472 [Auriculariales sp. MPI-PUGE-AT-0066]|nr:hypothetical protein BKA62DRAFT_689472 [Auriculariales sp. MPI-PUGE-AT-0066]
MTSIAEQYYATAPRTTLSPPASSQPQCTFSKALDSVKLTETFLGIAASLRKPRGALMRTGN